MSQPQALSASFSADGGEESPPEIPDLAQEFRDYAYIVSHDLGAPARLMVEFARLLARKAERLRRRGRPHADPRNHGQRRGEIRANSVRSRISAR
ncbi:MAG: hypothetical protein WDN06_04555 [Asticcacaulis sp.]